MNLYLDWFWEVLCIWIDDTICHRLILLAFSRSSVLGCWHSLGHSYGYDFRAYFVIIKANGIFNNLDRTHMKVLWSFYNTLSQISYTWYICWRLVTFNHLTWWSNRLGNVEFVICRDANGNLNAFHNVCRHHASLLACGSGQKTCFQCPYHVSSLT